MAAAETESTSLITRFQEAGQGQVFAFWDRLDSAQQAELLHQAGEIDLEEITHLKRTLLDGGETAAVDWSGLAPAPYESHPTHGGDAAAWAAARATGEAALRAGRVAAFTVAGGQGTRLGFDGPKGTFPVTPVAAKSLFQVFAEKIAAAGARYGCTIPWLIMTSHQNHAATETYFADNAYFGLADGQVEFFRQGRMPAVDQEGKIMLESPGSIALSPDGHGGSLRALHRSGALDRLAAQGIDTISYFQVDNPLVRCIDPAFIGWHLQAGSEMSSKMVAKAYAAEKVGVFCQQGGKVLVVEYSDLPMALQEETDPATGELRYRAGSIALHVLDREFVHRLATGGPDTALPFHRANKKIPTIDAAGEPVKPTEPNGIKFEMFVFDALPFARQPLVIETLREDDFSPVKNAEGQDSPAMAKRDQLRQFARWAQAAGVPLEVDANGDPGFEFEVAPGFAEDAETFAASWQSRDPNAGLKAGIVLQ